MQLESGMVDAVACDLSIAQYQMAAKPGIFKMLPEQLSSEPYAVAFKKGNDGLADQVTCNAQGDGCRWHRQGDLREVLCRWYQLRELVLGQVSLLHI